MNETVFVAGASGALGRRLIPLLVEQGYVVLGATRSAERAGRLTAAGAQAIIVDAFDAEGLRQAIVEARPGLVINQLTSLTGLAKNPGATRSANARLRREGARNLMAAALQAGTRRVIAQSIAWAYAPGEPPYTETRPLDLTARGHRRTTIVDGVVPLEQATLTTRGVEGVVLRYGQLYGPGAWNQFPEGPSPLHVDAAAHAAVLAITRGTPGVYNIVEDASDASNAKAVAELGWRPDYRRVGG